MTTYDRITDAAFAFAIKATCIGVAVALAHAVLAMGAQ